MIDGNHIAIIGSTVVGMLLATLTDRMVRGTRARRLMIALAAFIFVVITASAILLTLMK